MNNLFNDIDVDSNYFDDVYSSQRDLSSKQYYSSVEFNNLIDSENNICIVIHRNIHPVEWIQHDILPRNLNLNLVYPLQC